MKWLLSKVLKLLLGTIFTFDLHLLEIFFESIPKTSLELVKLLLKKEFKNNFIDFDSMVYKEFEGIEISKTIIFGLPLSKYENS